MTDAGGTELSGIPEPEDVAEEVPDLSTTKKVVFSLILFVICFAVLEGASNVYLRVTRGYDGEHLIQYEFDAYKNLLPTRNFVDTRGIRHNSQGFRHPVDGSRFRCSWHCRSAFSDVVVVSVQFHFLWLVSF